ncbi:MAG: glycosyltransferase family 2 protein [Rhodobacteraceae bacterium]|nr:glycosyltransferase family 2 protein [Paracoccaceae bacterium]
MGFSHIKKLRQPDSIRPQFAANVRKPPAEPNASYRIVVGIPTVGRAGILESTVKAITNQTYMPDLVLISVADQQDAVGLDKLSLPFPVRILIGKKGLTVQRNRIIDELHQADLILFLDDDFLMAPDYIEQMVNVFENHPSIVLATGKVLADGIKGPGYDHATGLIKLAEGLTVPVDLTLESAHTGYGCNTAIRANTILKHKLRYDEALPLYGWLEDVDFSNRLAPYGRFVCPGGMRGVHLGTKTGRTPGRYLGYSQIANPIYLVRKGTISRKRARDLMLRNIASNLRGTLLPRPWADYRGRLWGNLTAIWEVLCRRDRPDRILDLKP